MITTSSAATAAKKPAPADQTGKLDKKKVITTGDLDNKGRLTEKARKRLGRGDDEK